eukprot:TRINITY_DN2868_c0_g1_i5.p1 TRINITY_DN2868_c0_g1~~TRINITY_DN2868_c0_g1_i5.p1  ORF type:complete len:236 (-),score=9.19 TRINITY_DN2868_c0_g1_i5:24-731(-)
MMAIPTMGIYLTAYEHLKVTLPLYASMPAFYVPFFAGAIGRMIAVTVTSPLEFVRTNLQASSNISMWKVIQTATNAPHSSDLSIPAKQPPVWQRLRPLWTGLGPTLLRDVPFSAIYWSAYEALGPRVRSLVASDYSPVSHSQKLLIDFGAGTLAGSMAAFITTPADVLKTKQQTQLLASASQMNTWQRVGWIWRHEGVSGFFKGLVPRLAKVAPSCGIMIASYEGFKTHLFQKKS